MKFAKALSMVAAVLVLMAGAFDAAVAQDELTAEPGIFHSHIYYDFGTGLLYSPGASQVQLAGDVYNNTNPQAPPNFGFSSNSPGAQFGDRVLTTGTGILQENDFTIYNSGSSVGPLFSASFNIGHFDAATMTLLGAYTTGVVTFGATGLLPGQFSIITVTGLSGLNINVNTTDVLIVQQIATKTGTADRLGIASLDPPTIGSSSNTMYINAASVGPAGYYNIGGGTPLNANPGYRINLAQPVPASSKTWGAIKAAYRN
jgi:hypothetical protein